jgi:hypothetical protein
VGHFDEPEAIRWRLHTTFVATVFGMLALLGGLGSLIRPHARAGSRTLTRRLGIREDV